METMPDFTEDLAALVTKEEDGKLEEATTESQPETAKTEPTPSPEDKQPAEEKEVPFHKHPRWKRMTSELDELRAFKEEQSKKAQEVPKVEPKPISQVPPQYQKVFGDDVESFKEWRGLMREQAREEAKALLQEQKTNEEREQNQSKEANAKAVSFAEGQLQELADDTGIDFTTGSNTQRNQILEIVTKYSLFTPEGYPNIKLANELREKLYPSTEESTVDEKKKIIAKTNAKNNVVQKDPDVWTPSKLRKKSISQFFS